MFGTSKYLQHKTQSQNNWKHILKRKKEFQKISNLLEKNGFPLNYINRQIQHFLAKKQSKKPKTDKKDDTKRIFMKLPYIKEMNGHIPKEINGFLEKVGL